MIGTWFFWPAILIAEIKAEQILDFKWMKFKKIFLVGP